MCSLAADTSSMRTETPAMWTATERRWLCWRSSSGEMSSEGSSSEGVMVSLDLEAVSFKSEPVSETLLSTAIAFDAI